MESLDPVSSEVAPAQDRAEVLARLRERILAFAASRLARDAAEDLVQEVMLLLHEKYARVERIEELIPLSLQILRFKLVAHRRKAYRRGEYSQVQVEDLPLADLGPDPEARAECLERAGRLESAMGRLCTRCRQIFRMKLDGKSFAEIQKALGAPSINTVYTWDFRCRKDLLRLLGGSWE